MKSEILSLIQKKIEEISSIYNSTTGGMFPIFDLIEEFEKSLCKFYKTSDIYGYLMKNLSEDDYNEVISYISGNSLVNYLIDNYVNVLKKSEDLLFDEEMASKLSDDILLKLYNLNIFTPYLLEEYLSKIDSNLINYLDKYDKRILYSRIEQVSDEELSSIISNKLLYNIEYCKPIINDLNKIKRVIDAGYNRIILYIDSSKFTDEMCEYIHNINLKKEIENARYIAGFESDKIFELFLKDYCTDDEERFANVLLSRVPNESLTKKKVLLARLYGADNSNITELIDQENVEDLKEFINNGFKVNDKSVLKSTNEVKLFLENGQEDVIKYNRKFIDKDLVEYILNSNIDVGIVDYLRFPLTKEDIDNYISNPSIFLLTIYDCYDKDKYTLSNIEENYKELNNRLLLEKGDMSYYEFFNKIGIIDKALELNLIRNKSFKFKGEDWSEIYKNKYSNFKQLEQYVNFFNESKIDLVHYDLINSINDIEKYFDDNGVKTQLLDKILCASSYDYYSIEDNKKYEISPYKIIRDNYSDLYINNLCIYSYLKYDGNRFIKPKKLTDLDEFFNNKGATEEFYDAAISNNCYDVFFDGKYLDVYTDDVKKQYIKYKLMLPSLDRIIFSSCNTTIYNFIDENGLKDNCYYNALFEKECFNEFYVKNNLQINKFSNNKKILDYIDFYKEHPNFYGKINNIDKLDKYFDENGIKKNFLDEFLFKRFDSCFKNSDKYLDIYKEYPVELSYINLRRKYSNFFIYLHVNDVSDIYKYFDSNGFKSDTIVQLFKQGIVPDDADFINDVSGIELLDKKLVKCIKNSVKIENINLRKDFVKLVNGLYDEKVNYDLLSENDIDEYTNLFSRIENSNSAEIRNLGSSFSELLLSDTTDISLLNNKFNEVEKTFVETNLPYVAKAFKVFKILYPRYDVSRISSKHLSPVLSKAGTDFEKDIIIFSDLLKCSLQSNNRSIKKYIDSIGIGDKIYKKILNNEVLYNELSVDDKRELDDYVNHLKILYDFTKNKKDVTYTGDTLEDIKLLNDLFENKDDLKDRLTRMFLYFTNVRDESSLDEEKQKKLLTYDRLKSYLDCYADKITERNKKRAENETFNLQFGDYIKGIGDIAYLGYLLNNGLVAKEFLGSGAGSDMTPLDTDFSRVLATKYEDGKLVYSIPKQAVNIKFSTFFSSNLSAKNYGPIWVVLKNKEDRFYVSRNANEEFKLSDVKKRLDKYEMFTTLQGDHYGLRTGFPSSEIDYLLTKEPFDKKIAYEIVMNGFYIPVVNDMGELVFTPEMYDEIKNKTQGLSFFNNAEYKLKDSSITEETLNISKILNDVSNDTKVKRDKIYELINKAIIEFCNEENIEPYKFKTSIDGDISSGSVELLDTGSTGRNTNIPYDGDFDLLMRIDRQLMLDTDKLDKFKKKIVNTINPNCSKNFVGGVIREFKAKIDVNGKEEDIDLDISFITKTNSSSLEYPTEECVKDRLNNIKEQYPDKYNIVVANIILAKKMFKGIGAYKNCRKDSSQGGMGGVGIENWVLQNGGSLDAAIKDFYKNSLIAKKKSLLNDTNEFLEFRNDYLVFDFGCNHFSEKKLTYAHSNYVADNMNEVGYDKIKKFFDLYLKFERENGYTSVDEVLKIFNSNDNTSEITASDLLDSVDSIDENIDEIKKLI